MLHGRRSHPRHPASPARRLFAAAMLASALVSSIALPAFAGPVGLHSPLAQVESIQHHLTDVVDQAAGSVFAVTSFAEAPTESALWLNQLHGNAFANFVERATRNCGSAFAIGEDGTLLTNEHVVSGAASVWVTDDAGHAWPAIVVGTDPRSDLAVIRIPHATRPLALSQAANRGELVVTLGNPDGLAAQGEMAAAVGCVSAVGRSLPTLSARERRSYSDLIQTTTPITAGSSGGPLLDLAGNAVGIMTAVAPAEGTRETISFAISFTPAVLAVVDHLRRGEEVTHSYLGVVVAQRQTHGEADATLTGARIDTVEPDAPAAGVLRAGDVVIRFAGEAVASADAFVSLSAASPVDRDIVLVVRRDGEEVELSIRPARRAQPADPVTRATQSLVWAGVEFRNADNGVAVIRSTEGSPLTAGSVINTVNGQPIADVGALLNVLHGNAGKPLKIELQNDASDSK